MAASHAGDGTDGTDGNPAEPKPPKRVVVTIRTPAGIGHPFEVGDHDGVDQTVRAAVDYFVPRLELAFGNYGLAIIRAGEAVEMPDSAGLQDFDVVDGDVLALINKDAQVDG